MRCYRLKRGVREKKRIRDKERIQKKRKKMKNDWKNKDQKARDSKIVDCSIDEKLKTLPTLNSLTESVKKTELSQKVIYRKRISSEVAEVNTILHELVLYNTNDSFIEDSSEEVVKRDHQMLSKHFWWMKLQSRRVLSK